jgi:Fe-S cluster assembly protein SufD
VIFDRPVELFYLTDSQATGTMVSARNQVRAGQGSSLTVVEHFTGPATRAVMNTPFTEVFCAEDSIVRHLKIIRESADHLHFGSTHVRQMARSSYTSREFALGGQSIRRELHLDLDGEGASCDLTALYMGSGKQRLDMRTRVNHNVPGCQTNELYKGLLDGEARAVFDGLIKVARDAQQTAAFQTNRNLVLSDDTIAYSIPRLEIYADDVKCSHGSTTGQLDDEQLFFLRTRGFDPVTARIMLANAFASEVIEGVLNADLRQSLSREIADRLGHSSVGRERS